MSTSTAILERLVSFDTTSRGSNLDLIDWIADYLGGHGIDAARVTSGDGGKANLYASIGPAVTGGIVLSGHTDVVPVDGQDWSTPPFELTRRGDRLHGRGTCDMKGFIACALAAVPHFARGLARPVHFAFSYDEEVGCLGAPAMIAAMRAALPRPAAVIVGEPSLMRPIGRHKGIQAYEVRITGHEAHSSLTHLGISANEIAVRLMACLYGIADNLKTGAADSAFMPPYPTLTIGRIEGGTALNILAGACRFLFDLRSPPGFDADAALAPFHALVTAERDRLRRDWPHADIVVDRIAAVPAFATDPDGAAEQLVRQVTGVNQPPGAVPFGSEAGQFEEAGWSTMICGPGSIDQAHQPDEFVAIEQLAACDRFMADLAQRLTAA